MIIKNTSKVNFSVLCKHSRINLAPEQEVKIEFNPDLRNLLLEVKSMVSVTVDTVEERDFLTNLGIPFRDNIQVESLEQPVIEESVAQESSESEIVELEEIKEETPNKEITKEKPNHNKRKHK